SQETSIDINTILSASKAQLNNQQQAYLSQLENSVVRGDTKNQQAAVYRQLASFWKDSAHLLLPYAYYTGQAAELENSEKSLTFAAHFFLESLRQQNDPGLKRWMGTEAKKLFEKALLLDPGNDSLKIGLGSCYLFGNISENPMEGIQMIREVAERDPNNMSAQFTLGMGSMISGQIDKAIERLSIVIKAQPQNLEVMVMLAEAYEQKGDNVNAVKWYEASKKLIDNPDINSEIDKRIKLLKK
ncbi:MAG TPA: tetratricopeptide repeat protein, partial [Chitinophagaceae bacterium]|nr:tetratricopeptide repeat protein [Chitinophagaceae bacterium]